MNLIGFSLTRYMIEYRIVYLLSGKVMESDESYLFPIHAHTPKEAESKFKEYAQAANRRDESISFVVTDVLVIESD